MLFGGQKTEKKAHFPAVNLVPSCLSVNGKQPKESSDEFDDPIIVFFVIIDPDHHHQQQQ